MLNYQEALSFIHNRPRLHKEPTLERMKLLLARLGNPQTKSHYIHVAGTNGKGSVTTFLSNLLLESGLNVGSYTSPFIVKFNERIRVNNKMISDQSIVDLIAKIQPVVEKMDAELSDGPTEFEIDTAMMFLYFAEHPVDVVIVEVGIGGKWDATNVLIPEVSVITTIGYDHMKLLGNTLPEIAEQKAGIVKSNRPLITGKIPSNALAVILKQAQLKNSPVLTYQDSYHVKQLPIKGWHEEFNYQDDNRIIKDIKTNLMGDFQVQNSAVAITAYLEYLKLNHLPFNPINVKRGIAAAQWPGRFEKVNESPLIVIDGAHNEPAFKELRKNVKKYFNQHDVYIILSILSDKQYKTMIETLADIKNVHLVLTEFTGPKNRHVANLKELAAGLPAAHPVEYDSQWQIALQSTVSKMSDDDVLILAGSLYFISEVRKLF